MGSPKKASDTTIYQIKISLKEVKPPIWRRVQVLSSTTLQKFHTIVEEAMGWYDCHLHQFLINGEEYGEPSPDCNFGMKDEKKVKLAQVVTGEKIKFSYIDDFGDSWEHEILV